MTELSATILSATLTVIGGVIIFVAGQVAIKFFVEPIYRLRLQIGRVDHAIYYYADLYTNSVSDNNERSVRVAKHFRTHAAELRAKGNAVAWYRFWSLLRFVPAEENVTRAAEGLVRISKSISENAGDSETHRTAQKVVQHLGLRLTQ